MQNLKLDDIVTISKGRKHTVVLDSPSNTSKRYIQIDDLRNNLNLKFTDEQGVDVSEKDLIIAWDGANAGTIGFNLKGYIGSTLARLRLINGKVDPEYLGWLLRSKFDYLRAHCTGATIPHISRSALGNISVPNIPNRVQQTIVRVLTQIDLARQKRREASRLTEEFLKSAFLEMFGDPVRNERGWEVNRLEDFISFLTSGSRGWAKYYSLEGDLFIRIENVGRSRFFLEDSKLQFVIVPKNAEAKRTEVQAGDLLVSITADLGRTAVVPKLKWRGFINQHLALIRLKDGIDAIFLSHYFSSEGGQMQFRSMNKGGVKAGLNFDDIKSLKFILPPLPLQQKFAALVEQVERLQAKQRESERELESLFQSLMQRYFG